MIVKTKYRVISIVIMFSLLNAALIRAATKMLAKIGSCVVNVTGSLHGSAFRDG